MLFLLLCTCSPASVTSTDEPTSDVSTTAPALLRTRHKPVKVPLTSKWDFAPDIVLCHGAPVTELRVFTALAFWEKLGYEFGRVRTLNHLDMCSPQWGHITFRLPTAIELSAAINSDHLATTRYSSLIAMPEILVMSEIYFQTDNVSELPRVVEHELGHALGWHHTTYENHLMHPVYRSVGSVTTGLEIENYNTYTIKIHK